MGIYVDATTLIALGSVGRLEWLTRFDGECVVPRSVVNEVTSDPANHRLQTLLEDENGDGDVRRQSHREIPDEHLAVAKRVLDREERNGDVDIVASILWAVDDDRAVAVVSDDRRVRTVADDFGARVTGTIGVVVRAVHEGLPAEEAKTVVREIDSRGLHLTGELRETAFDLIDEAAEGTDRRRVFGHRPEYLGYGRASPTARAVDDLAGTTGGQSSPELPPS